VSKTKNTCTASALKLGWVLKLHQYESPQGLLASFKEKVIDPSESKARELEKK
jgi:hypothetical protein